jgi:hypothetical protein
MDSGIDKAWSLIEEKGPEGICRETGLEYNAEDGCYGLLSLGMMFRVCPGLRMIKGNTEEARSLYERLAYYFDHSALWYLAESRGAGRTGRLINPSDLKGGHHFFTRGTHVLPLDELAGRYATDAGAFLEKGGILGGVQRDFGDAAVELLPLPMVPVVIALWRADDEFPARADLFLDSSAEYHAPLDALWAVSMLALRAMM